MIRRIVRKWPYFLGLAILVLIYLAWPGKDSFTVGPETTHATGPVMASGTVDYIQAINEKLRQGITPETNANVLLWKVLGPHPEGVKQMPEGYFESLGIPAPPEEGHYYLPWKNFVDGELKKLAGAEAEHELRGQWTKEWEYVGTKPWRKEDYPQLACWLELNEKPLALFIEATHRQRYYNPLIPTHNDPRYPRLIESLLPNVQLCRDVVNALCRRAMLRAAAEQYDLAWKDLTACLRLGQLLTQSGTLIESLVGYACTKVACDTIAGLLEQKLPSTKTRAWLGEIQSLPAMRPGAEAVEEGERMMMLDVLSSLIVSKDRFQLDSLQAVGEPGRRAKVAEPSFWNSLFSPGINWDPAYKTINAWIDRNAEIARIPDYPTRMRAFRRHDSDIKALKRDLYSSSSLSRFLKGRSGRGELYGELIVVTFLPAVEKISAAEERIQQILINTQLALALSAYRADQGTYPKQLADLAPKYLKAIPPDRFSLLPLHYESTPDTYFLYSIGANLEDENGYSYDDQPRGDDITIRMPNLPPPPLDLPFELPD